MVFTNFGANTETHRYQEKHVIDAQVTDNLGRPSYRVFRYQRDSAGVGSWEPTGSYFITPLADRIEIIDDNQRVIKLHLPLNEGHSWKGNQYVSDDAYEPLYHFNNDDNIATWDSYYDTFESSTSYRNNNYTDVWTVEIANESYNIPIVDP